MKFDFHTNETEQVYKKFMKVISAVKAFFCRKTKCQKMKKREREREAMLYAGNSLYMSRKGPGSCLGMLDFVEDWKLDVILH